MRKKSFVPYANTAGIKSSFTRSPLLQTNDLDVPHFGHSLLFDKLVDQTGFVQIMLNATIQFYTFDGNDNGDNVIKFDLN